MRALIAAKANIEELGVGDWRPLHTAVRGFCFAFAGPLLFIIAQASSGCLGAVEVLIENGAQVNARASDGTTPLIKAATNKRRQVCSYLIQHGADANIVGDMKLSALMHAARVGDLELTQILVEEGNANVTAVDHAGNTALDIAEQHNMSEVAIYLWHRGADSAALRSASGTVANLLVSTY
jgi:ankyrin repeat protein